MKTDLPPAKDYRAAYLRRLRGRIEERMLHYLRTEAWDPLTGAERPPSWTPIHLICHDLEMSQSCLSRFMREHTGMNNIQLYDRVKLIATAVHFKYLALVNEFITESRTSRFVSEYAGDGSKYFWAWLKEKRDDPHFNRKALAREFKFPSAQRFHRAFLLALKKTPREFENETIRAAVKRPDEFAKLVAQPTDARNTGKPRVVQNALPRAAESGGLDSTRRVKASLRQDAGK